MKGYPSKKEIKWSLMLNQAIDANVRFSVYRSIEGKVHQFNLIRSDVNRYTGEITVSYKNHLGEYVHERATMQDLELLSDRARQLQQAAYAGKERFEIVRK